MNAKHRDVIADVFARIDSDLFYYEPNKQLFLLLFDCYMAGEETTVESVNKRHPQEIKAISKKLQTSIIQMALGYHRLNFEENLMEKSEDMIGLMADSLVIRKKMRDLHEIQTRIAKGLVNEESPEKTYAAIETLLLKNNSSS
jgi:replicative DNA helicase